jgi:hypothetical protein
MNADENKISYRGHRKCRRKSNENHPHPILPPEGEGDFLYSCEKEKCPLPLRGRARVGVVFAFFELCILCG